MSGETSQLEVLRCNEKVNRCDSANILTYLLRQIFLEAGELLREQKILIKNGTIYPPRPKSKFLSVVTVIQMEPCQLTLFHQFFQRRRIHFQIFFLENKYNTSKIAAPIPPVA